MARKKGTEDVSFSFISNTKKAVKEHEREELECHNGLCAGKSRCAVYKGDEEGIHRVKRNPTTCRIYTPKETEYVGKNKRY